jgi:diacylglycerol kinase family enzyme
MMIAPHAAVDDGRLDVTIIGDLSLATFLRYSGKIYKGEHLGMPEISSRRGATVIAEPLGKAPILIDLDGEQPGRLPVRYEVVPEAIRLLAPWPEAVAVSGGAGR